MVKILGAVLTDGLEAVEAACADPIRIPAGLRGEAVGKWTAIVTQAIDANARRR